jgi:hypothetical protein
VSNSSPSTTVTEAPSCSAGVSILRGRHDHRVDDLVRRLCAAAGAASSAIASMRLRSRAISSTPSSAKGLDCLLRAGFLTRGSTRAVHAFPSGIEQ